MKTKELIGQLMVYSTIYDVDLPEKILHEMEAEQLHLDSEKMYDVEILFDTEVFKLDEFYSFNVANPSTIPGRRKKLSEAEKKRQKIYIPRFKQFPPKFQQRAKITAPTVLQLS